MSNFCANCGAATGGGKFCPKCGATQAAGAAAPVGAQMPYAPVPPKPQSSALKVVLIILGVFLLLGVVGAVGAVYFVKNKVQQIAREAGGKDWRDAVSSAAKAQPTQAGCELLSKEQVSQILDMPVARAEGNEAGDVKEYCNYWSDASKADPKTPDEDEDAASKDIPANVKDLQKLAKKISAASGKGALLNVQVFRGTAKAGLIAIKAVNVLSSQRQASIEGPWDEAYFGPMDALLFVRKGDNGVLLDLHHVTPAREKGLALAKAMIESL